jgi:hypothetical protein
MPSREAIDQQQNDRATWRQKSSIARLLQSTVARYRHDAYGYIFLRPMRSGPWQHFFWSDGTRNLAPALD